MKLFSVFMSNLDFDPRMLMSSKIAVEYKQIKLWPVKLLNSAIAIQINVEFLVLGSVRAYQMLFLSY